MKKFLLILAGASSLALSTTNVMAADKILSPVSGWNVEKLKAVGSSSACLVYTQYEDGVSLSLEALQSQLSALRLSVASGSFLALPIAMYYHYNPIELAGDMDAMMEDYGMEPLLPFSLDSSIWLTHGSIMLIISLILSLYSIITIYRLNPVKAMRR